MLYTPVNIAVTVPAGKKTYLPGLFAGTGCIPLPTLSVSSGLNSFVVISDAYTPGAIAFTRTENPLSAISVERSLVKCDAAAFALL